MQHKKPTPRARLSAAAARSDLKDLAQQLGELQAEVQRKALEKKRTARLLDALLEG